MPPFKMRTSILPGDMPRDRQPAPPLSDRMGGSPAPGRRVGPGPGPGRRVGPPVVKPVGGRRVGPRPKPAKPMKPAKLMKPKRRGRS